MTQMNLYATTIEQSKRLIDAGLPDNTADMRYMWEGTTERQVNFFKKKKVSRFQAITRFSPQIGIICDTGDLEILQSGVPLYNDNKDVDVVYEDENNKVVIRSSSPMGQWDIPSWTLTALLNLIPYGGLQRLNDKWYYSLKGYDGKPVESAVEAAVQAVIHCIKAKIIEV
jgi:hypothetical protein